MNFETIAFNKLSLNQLYTIYKLRSKVFVVEQNCPYQDIDEYDLIAHHVLVLNFDEIIGYARILPANSNYPEPSIGRVLVEKEHRAKNLGKRLMDYCITQTKTLYPGQKITISAQTYLLKFYSNLGFTAVGTDYLEDNIPHIKMYL